MSMISDLGASIKKVLFVPVHPAGYPFIIIFFAVTFIGALIDETLGLLLLPVALWCVYFFRDPVRVTPKKAGLIVSPADGMVSAVAKNVTLPEELDELDTSDATYTRVSIFLNVFDVHVNRVPVAGKIIQTVYKPGKFLNANLDKASEENERSAALVKTKDGVHVGFVQIAGLIARRIICDLEEKQDVKTGEKYGIIRFGSRADVYLPKGVSSLVCVGQRMIGGETVLADYKSKEKARIGEVVEG